MDLSKYYTEICKVPMLTTEEEQALFTLYTDPATTDNDKDRIRDQIIKANLRYAFKQARYFSKNDPEVFEDLIGYANEGLMVAFDKYDFSKGNKFLTYAGSWVNQRIWAAMAQMRIVSLPIWKQQIASKIQRLKDRNENITLDEVRVAFEGSGVSDKDLIDLFDTKYLTFYIEDISEEEFSISPIENELMMKMDDERLIQAITKLSSPYREIITKSYGFTNPDLKESSVTKIAKELRLTKAQVATYKEEGLEILRDILNVQYGDTYFN
jgi:RNA polymerase primary sigma factor